jgi:hypothetical protein
MEVFSCPEKARKSRFPPSCSPNTVSAFSDGVIAIVITLLILEIKVPELEGASADSAHLLHDAVVSPTLFFRLSDELRRFLHSGFDPPARSLHMLLSPTGDDLRYG